MSLLVPTHPGSPRQRAIRMYVICLCLCVCIFMLLCLVVLLQHNKQTVIIILDSNGNVHCMMNAIMPTKSLRRFIRLYLNTHTTSLRPFLHDYPGEPVQKKSSSGLYGATGDIRGRHTNNVARRHSIQTNERPPPSSPHFYAGCHSCHNNLNLFWLGTGTKYAGLHTQWLVYDCT